jgi:hypothetical protein
VRPLGERTLAVKPPARPVGREAGGIVKIKTKKPRLLLISSPKGALVEDDFVKEEGVGGNEQLYFW